MHKHKEYMSKLFGGEQKNIVSISNGAYAFIAKAMSDMDKRAWDFDIVKTLHEDKIAFAALPPYIQLSFIKSLARVTSVDFSQLERLSGILSQGISSNELKLLLQKQAHEELVHTRAYFYIIESVLDNTKGVEDLLNHSEEISAMARIPLQCEQYIMSLPLSDAHKFALHYASNVFLEMLVFFTNFIWFAHLSLTTGKFSGTLATIKYIVKDELEHGLGIFIPAFKKHLNEHGIDILDIQTHVEHIQNIYSISELQFAKIINGADGEGGIHPSVMEQYICHRVQNIYRALGAQYTAIENPLPHLDDILGISAKQRNDSFFSSIVTDYDKISVTASDIIIWGK